MRTIKEIIVHCTATQAGRNFKIEDIDRWHRERGFNSIGYHYVIYLDGTVHTGRPVEKIGAHCLGHNKHSVGVCYVGGLDASGAPADTRTDAQKTSLRAFIKDLKRRFPSATVHGHREFAAKACPCFDAKKEYENV